MLYNSFVYLQIFNTFTLGFEILGSDYYQALQIAKIKIEME